MKSLLSEEVATVGLRTHSLFGSLSHYFLHHIILNCH